VRRCELIAPVYAGPNRNAHAIPGGDGGASAIPHADGDAQAVLDAVAVTEGLGQDNVARLRPRE